VLCSRLIHVVSLMADPSIYRNFKQIKFLSDHGLAADLCLGMVIAGVNILIGIALIIVFA
jgi:hypothetical protein